jgi:hypothetical protein
MTTRYSNYYKYNDYYKEYRARNKDKRREYNKEYYENVFRPLTLTTPEYHRKLLDDHKKYYKNYYEKNKSEIKRKASIAYQNKKNFGITNNNNNNNLIPITIERYNVTLHFN